MATSIKGKKTVEHDVRYILSVKMQELLNMEARFAKVLRLLAKKAGNEDLQGSFAGYAERADKQAGRLEKVLKVLGAKPQRIESQALRGWAADTEWILKNIKGIPAQDAALVAAVRSALRYEIGSYSSAFAWAKLLKENGVADMFEETLEEIAEAEEELGDLAEAKIDSAAVTEEEKGGEDDGDDDDDEAEDDDDIEEKEGE